MLVISKTKLLARMAMGCCVALAALAFTGTAQAQLTLTAGSASNPECNADEILIPVTVSEAAGITSFGVRMDYDVTKLDFLGTIKGAGVADWGLVNGNEPAPGGSIILGGSAFAGTAVTGTAELIVLRFTSIQGACPSIAALDLNSASANTASAVLVDGQITSGEFPTLRIDDVSAACASGISVPVFADNITSAITSFGVRINYDNTKLDFTGVTKGADTADWGLVNGNEPAPGGSIILGGSAFAGTPLTGDVELIIVNFTFIETPLTGEPLTLNSPSANTATFQLDSGSASCIDNQAPVATCVGPLSVNLSEGVILAGDLDGGSTDPDSDPLTFQVNGGASYALSCADVTNSPITLTLTVSDGSLEDTCEVQVTVVDDVDPIASTQNITVNLSAGGSVDINAAQVDAGSADDCSAVTLSVAPSTFSCANRGNNAVVLTVTDEAGNTATANATVTVLDVTPPTAVAQNLTVQLGANGQATITAAQVNNGSSDACGIGGLSLNRTSFSCADVGTPVTVTLTVSDTNNPPLTSTATATITVVDSIDPTAVAQDVVVSLDENGVATVTAEEVNNGSTDNCGTPTLSLDVTSFTCANLGANEVTLTVTDGSGNEATATATVTVLDEIGPSLDVVSEPVTLSLSAAGTAVLAAEAVYLYGTDNCAVTDGPTLSQTDFGCADLGENTVTVSIADASGNTAEADVIVNVIDEIAPTAIAQDITVQLGADGTATITADDVNNGSSDNCSVTLAIDIDTFTCADTDAPVTVTLTATDQGGLTATATALVTVVDSIDPVISAASTAVVELDETGNAVVTIDDLVTEVTDNCGVASVEITSGQTSFTCADVDGSFDIVVTATDTSGNIETATITVSVTDPTGACAVEEGEGEGEGAEDPCTDLDNNGVVDDPSACLEEDIVLGFTNVGVEGGCLLETRQVLFTNTDGTGNVTLSVPDPNNFEVTVTVTIARSAIPVGESAIFVVKVACDLANLLSGDASASILADNLTRDNVPVNEIIPGTYVLATVFQQDGDTFTEVDGVSASITYTGLEVNTVEDPQVYQHGTVVDAGTDGPLTNGDANGSWNEAATTLEGTDVIVGVNGLSVFVVTQPAPLVPFLAVSPNATYARIVGFTNVGSSRTLTFTVRNAGPGTVAGSATVTGTGFSIQGDANYTLAGETTDTVTVSFAPATEGTFQGSITFTGGDNGPVTIALWGVGTTAVKTAFFGCGAADGAGMGFGDLAVVGLLLSVLVAASRLWVRARQN
ncbi:MAG: hypothetical protein RLZZ303_80 [Candidatus Hydrogenedentota bacterium]